MHRRFWQQRKSSFLVCAALVFGLAAAAFGAEERKPLIYGLSARPFPAIAGLDYPYCRAKAWLDSLARANQHLPDIAFLRLRLPGPDPALARLAICALIAPVDVVTPPNAPGAEIRVFRKWPDDPLKQIELVIGRTFIIELEMALIWEMQRAVADLGQIWPASVAAASDDAERLEEFARLLADLWQAAEFNAGAAAGRPGSYAKAFAETAASGAILLAMARERPGELTGPLARALAIFMQREAREPASRELWQSLAAEGLYLRGLGHQGSAQPGLAAADFGAALARLGKGDPGLAAQIHMARGELSRQGGNMQAMCADFEAACALGQCASLAQARRLGHCRGSAE